MVRFAAFRFAGEDLSCLLRFLRLWRRSRLVRFVAFCGGEGFDWLVMLLFVEEEDLIGSFCCFSFAQEDLICLLCFSFHCGGGVDLVRFVAFRCGEGFTCWAWCLRFWGRI